jgi:hypothetical protein
MLPQLSIVSAILPQWRLNESDRLNYAWIGAILH